MLILIPSRTHNTSQQYTESFFQKIQRITLVTEKNLKSIQDENPISHSLINAISKQFSTFQNLKSVEKIKSVFQYLKQSCLLHNLKKLLIAFKDWSKH